jgi:hypothetical protein
MSRKDKTLRNNKRRTKKRRTNKRRTNKRRTKKRRTKKTRRRSRRRSKARQEGGVPMMTALAVVKSELIQSLIFYALGQLKKQGDKKCVKYAESRKDKSSSKDIKSCLELSQEVLEDTTRGIKNYSKWPKVFLKNLKKEFNIPDKNLSTIRGIKEFYNTVRRAKDDGYALKILEAFMLTNEEMKKDKSVTSPNPTTPSSLSKIYKGLKDKTGFGKKSESSLFQELEGDAEASYDEWMRGQILNRPLY